MGDITASGGSSFQSLTVRGEEGVASVVYAAAEALVLEAVAANSSSTCRLEFEVRALAHTRLTRGHLVQHGEAYGPASVL